MTFDLRITRRTHWMEPCDDDIRDEEWRSLVEADEELAWLRVAHGETRRGDAIEIASPLLAVWTKHPRDEEVWFDFAESSVIISDPDADTIDKIEQLAQLLQANVQDSRGEPYT